MVKVEIVPWDVHKVLIGALAAGQAMEDCARAVQDGGENVLNSFGNASTAEEAFRVFWEDRHELGLRAAAVLVHNVEKVSDAAGEFIAMDRDMSTKTEQTVAQEQAAQVSQALGLTS